MAEIIYSSSYALGSLHDGAPLNIYNDVVNCILAHAKDTESSAKLPALLSGIYQRGVDAGFGEEDRAALVKVL
jgi:3-hydroxyisobutyrate dehydrogenase-like beta-hydroxyacid dehydrogenase